ncbi:DNA polymerase II [Candidatus Bathyarchaeota archaeon]|nr:MAG: DNA polymerase II [Candidatus Bathyarchaeota archaeon]
MEIVFWLLDVNQEVVEGIPEIRIWGLDEKGKKILIVDRNFKPHFYVLPKNFEDAEILAGKIKNEIRDAIEVLVEDKKYFGKPVKAVKVILNNLENVEHNVKTLLKNPLVKEVLHDDLRYSSLYLVEQGLKPCGWHKVKVEKFKPIQNVKVDDFYLAKSKPEPLEKLDLPPLRLLAFSAIYHTKIGSPNPERDPILVISTLTNEGEKKIFMAKDEDDKDLLVSFVDYVQKFDPDIIVGYNSNRIDFPYMLQRSKKLGIKLALDRVNAEPHTSVYGHVSIVGRLNIDFLDLAEDMPEVKVKTLENVAAFLGVEKIEPPIKISETEIHQYWEDKNKRKALADFCEYRTTLVKKVSDSMLNFVFQLSNLIGIPADFVCAAAVGFRVDWYLIRKALALNELIPKRVEQPFYPYKGGMVLEPKPGLHENVAVLDFSSMYPNLMVKYNLSPDTYLKPEEPVEKVYVAPEVGHKFRVEPPGFYKQVLLELIEARRNIQKQMAKLEVDNPLYKILDARQRSIKVITNATYGYCGWRGARWYVSEVAEATAAWGRKTIMETIELAKKIGLEVVYGDTDSVFVKYDEEKIRKFLGEVEKKVGLEIRPDIVYRRILFTEAKKRYAGLLPDGKIDVVGLEVARGDWCEAAKQVQEKVLEIILREVNPKKAAEFVRNYTEKLREGISQLEPFIIWKTITKPIKDYQVKAPHVEAAKKLIRSGWNLMLGDKIGYVIVKGEGKLYEKAVPYLMAKPEKLDVNYYIENQIIPAALRILEMFGIRKEELGSLKPSKGLAQFF